MPTPLQRPSVELYFGKSGEGKTRLALSHIGPRPVILYDFYRQDVFTRNALIAEDPLQLVAALEKNTRRICWRGFELMGSAAAFEFANRCARAFGDRVLFWDDVDRYMPVHPVPVHADHIINGGRHQGLTIKASCRRPSNMPRNLTAAATRVHAYRVTGQRDLVYLGAEWFHEKGSQLPQLQRGSALVWTEAGGEAQKKIY